MTGVGGGSPQLGTLAWSRPDDQAVFRLKLLRRERREIYRDWWVWTPAKINVWPGDLQSVLAVLLALAGIWLKKRGGVVIGLAGLGPYRCPASPNLVQIRPPRQ
jgi:hypothetical protein